MKRQEKRRKFHEAVLDTLYPSSSPPVHDETSVGDGSFDVELINPDDFLRSDSSATEEDDGVLDGGSQVQKLSRAQRKRLRKKKLKENASRPRKLIGPLLESSTIVFGDGPQPVRRNVPEKDSVVDNKSGEESGCSNKNKLKKRRAAKRLAKEKFKTTGGMEDRGRTKNFDSSNELIGKED